MIYVHVPFCKSFCRYCDFYSEICPGKGPEEFDEYIDELCAEARLRRGEIINTLGVKTLYIGGGTPSVMPLRFFYELTKALDFGPYKEFTVEINPEDVVERGTGFLRSLKEFGVNRLSFGIQSLDDGILKWMGRRHNARTAVEVFHAARDFGFDNISVDIIFGIGSWGGASSTAAGAGDSGACSSGAPGSQGAGSIATLSATLDGILALGPEHISAYQLSIEDGSQLAADLKAGRYVEASDEECSKQYQLICSRLRDAGYEHYEISNWARAGKEAMHNSAYWTRRPYVGLGPGAHSLTIDRGTEIRSWNSEALSGWTPSHEVLTPEEIREERIMLGLRTANGIPVETLHRADGTFAHAVFFSEDYPLEHRPEGLDIIGDRVRINESFWFVADSIISDLI
ncbi:MAG: coproporphyrinogen III oxidase family protein [Bacteroidales bacterium]|nr:coproporphyrinogen III oxidase family protein [Bacteroidales bacterium]